MLICSYVPWKNDLDLASIAQVPTYELPGVISQLLLEFQ